MDKMTERTKTISSELNLDELGYIEIDMLHKYHVNFTEEPKCEEPFFEGNELYLNVFGRRVDEVIFDFWKAISKKLPTLRKNIAKAKKWLQENEINVQKGFFDELLEEMASDEYGILKTDCQSLVIERLIPTMTLSRMGQYESEHIQNILHRKMADENHLVYIRRRYLGSVRDRILKEAKGKPVKRLSILEQKQLRDSLTEEAMERGFIDKPVSVQSMVKICRQLGVRCSDKDNFDSCCKLLCKVFSSEEPDKSRFSKMDKEDMLKLYERLVPIVKEFLVPYYKKYVNEISMSKRGPIGELIINVMSNVAFSGATIATLDISGAYEKIVIDKTHETFVKNKVSMGNLTSFNERNQVNKDTV